MARFFKDFSELKPFVSSGNKNNDIDTLESFIDNAIEEFIVPLVGNDWVTGLEARYAAATLTAHDKILLKHLRAALANFCYYGFASEGNMTVDEMGFTTTVTGSTRPPFQWQIRDFKRRRLTDAWTAVNVLIKRLVEFRADYASWADSDEKAEHFAPFIWNADLYSRYRKIDGFGTLVALKPYMRKTLDYTIKATLGDTFFDAYSERFQANTLDAGEDALLPLLHRVIAFESIYHAASDLPVEVSAEGFRISEIAPTLSNDKAEKNAPKLHGIIQSAREQADLAISDLRKHLDTTATVNIYPEYLASDKYDSAAEFSTPNPDRYKGKSFIA